MLRGAAGKFRECPEMPRNKGEQTATRRDMKTICMQSHFYNLSLKIIGLDW
jgi:hypothetical protein